MGTRKSTEVQLKARPEGIPDESCFGFVERELPDPGEGEVLVRNVYMSVDPAMRPPLSNGQQKLDSVMSGQAIGSCGSEAKVAWLRELGFDHAFNHRDGQIRRELRKGAPDGIDVYFENVGGDHLDAALGRMRPGGRIPVCGMISAYNNDGARSEPVTALANMIYNRVSMKGFVAWEFLELRDRFLADMRGWLSQGRIQTRETILDGIERAPAALAGLFTGDNTGKMLVRLGPED